MFAGIGGKKLEKNSLGAIRDSYFFVLLFLIHIIVRLSPLILFLSMALGMLPATFMDILNSVAYHPQGDFILCKFDFELCAGVSV